MPPTAQNLRCPAFPGAVDGAVATGHPTLQSPRFALVEDGWNHHLWSENFGDSCGQMGTALDGMGA